MTRPLPLLIRLYGILEYRQKYNVDQLDPYDALTHPCKPFWVGEIYPEIATQGHVKGCVIQATVPRFVQAARLVV